MRRFLTTSFVILGLVVSVVGVAPTAHAAACTSASKVGDSCTTSNGTAGTCVASELATDCVATAAASSAASKASATGAGIATPPENPAGAMGPTLAGVMQWIMSLFAWLVGVAAITLDTAVFYTVVKMGDYVNNLTAITVAWTVLRDIGNIILIFGFLAVGITIVLNADWYGGGKKMIPMLLIVAVTLNFSLFAAKAVVDVGNLFATQFYTQINGGTLAGDKSLRGEGISNAIMAQLGLQTIYDDAKKNTVLFKEGNSWVIGFMGILLFLVTAFVMFSLAFILIARFIILIFLIILSPVGFAGMAVPKLQSSARMWWSTLFQQTLTAPVLLLLLYIALKVILDESFLRGLGATDPEGWTKWIGGGSVENFGGMILSFLVAMGLLLAVTMYAKKMSAFGASWATGMGGKLSFGATAFVGRRTVGRASNFAARKIRSSSLGHTETGRLLAGVADRGAKASFDVRGTSALKSFPGGGIDAGAAQKGGYEAREKELVKDRTDYAKSLKQSESQKREHEANLRPLENQLDVQQEASKRLISDSQRRLKAQREQVQEFQRRGDQAAANAASNVLNSLQNEHDELKQAETERLAPFRQAVQNEKDQFKGAAQTAYGKNLEKRTGIWQVLRAYDVGTATGSARREASSKILKDAKETDVEKARKALETAIERGSAPPPTPPPPTPGAGTT